MRKSAVESRSPQESIARDIGMAVAVLASPVTSAHNML